MAIAKAPSVASSVWKSMGQRPASVATTVAPQEAAWNRPVQGTPGGSIPAGMPPASQMIVAQAFRNRK